MPSDIWVGPLLLFASRESIWSGFPITSHHRGHQDGHFVGLYSNILVLPKGHVPGCSLVHPT